MKKLLILCFFILTSFMIFAEKVSIEEIISGFELNSSERKIENIETAKILIEKEALFFDKYCKLNLNIQGENNYYREKNKMPLTLQMTEGVVQYPGNYSFTANYNWLTFSGSYDLSKSKPITTSFMVSISKSINDLFYDEMKYKENSLGIREGQNKSVSKRMRQLKLENIIDLYSRIKNLEFEAEIKKNQLYEIEEQLEIIIEKEKIGEGSKLDVEYLGIESDERKEELVNLEKQVEIEKEKLKKEAGISYDKIELEPIKNITQKVKAVDYLLEEKQFEIQQEMENKKYSERQNQIDFTPGISYDMENKIWKAAFSITGNLFNFNGEAKIKEKQIERLEIEKKDIQDSIEIELKEKEEQYRSFEEKLKTHESKIENRKKRVDIYKRLAARGSVSFVDYLKELNQMEEAIIIGERVRNEFNAFKWKMRI